MSKFKPVELEYEEVDGILYPKIEISNDVKELMINDDKEYIDIIKEIGEFEFEYTFMKMIMQEDSKETFYYKKISKRRKLWLDEHSGIKIYRDNFLVRPY